MTIESCDRALVESLEAFTKSSEVPAPKFELLEVAVLEWVSGDDGTVKKELVQVKGVVWNPATAWAAGWYYYVRNLYPPFGNYLPVGHEEECSENDLRKWGG